MLGACTSCLTTPTWMCLGVEPGELLSSVLELGACSLCLTSPTWMCLGVEPGELLSSVLELGACSLCLTTPTWMCLGVEPGELLSSVLELGAAAGVARSRLARRKLLQLLFIPAAASAADKAWRSLLISYVIRQINMELNYRAKRIFLITVYIQNLFLIHVLIPDRTNNLPLLKFQLELQRILVVKGVY
jgi:hypothetical protein